MPVYAEPRPEERTCRGKSGKSKPHPHYEGGDYLRARDGAMVTRCSSCRLLVQWKSDPTTGRPAREGYQPIPQEQLADVGLAILANL